jgi:hypothetical protein
MATLRAKIAELERRILAIEARQLAWRYDAASRAGKPDSVADDLVDILMPSHGMLQAIAELRARCDEQRKNPDQVNIIIEGDYVFARALFGHDTEVNVSFDRPPLGFRRADCERLFREACNVE